MRTVLVAPGAVLPELLPLRMLPLVLGRVVIPFLALRAGQNDVVARHGFLRKLSAISYQLSVRSRVSGYRIGTGQQPDAVD
jgi:hypothetical protein